MWNLFGFELCVCTGNYLLKYKQGSICARGEGADATWNVDGGKIEDKYAVAENGG